MFLTKTAAPLLGPPTDTVLQPLTCPTSPWKLVSPPGHLSLVPVGGIPGVQRSQVPQGALSPGAGSAPLASSPGHTFADGTLLPSRRLRGCGLPGDLLCPHPRPGCRRRATGITHQDFLFHGRALAAGPRRSRPGGTEDGSKS